MFSPLNQLKMQAGILGASMGAPTPLGMLSVNSPTPQGVAYPPPTTPPPEQGFLDKLTSNPAIANALLRMGSTLLQASGQGLSTGEGLGLGFGAFQDSREAYNKNQLETQLTQAKILESLTPKAPEMPSVAREAQLLGYQVGTPEFNKYIMDSRAKGGVNVNINNEKLSPAQEAVLKVDGDTFAGIASAARASNAVLPDLTAIEQALPNFPTGAFGDQRLFLTQVAAKLGADVKEGAAAGELIQAIQSRLAPAMRPEGSGSSSDTDVKMFLNALPNITKSEGGNRVVISMFRKVAERRAAEENIARKLLSEKGSLDGFYQETSKLPALFSADEKTLFTQKNNGEPGELIYDPATRKWSQ